MPMGVAIGSAFRHDKPVLVVAMIDALQFAFHTGDEAIKEACRAAIRGMYRDKDT